MHSRSNDNRKTTDKSTLRFDNMCFHQFAVDGVLYVRIGDWLLKAIDFPAGLRIVHINQIGMYIFKSQPEIVIETWIV